MRVRLETTGAEYDLEEQPLGSGGEATVYALKNQPCLAAKLYRKPSPDYAAKLLAMLAAPPLDLTAKQHVSIAWPTSRLLAPGPDRLFLGYLMPRVHDTRLLYEVYNPRSRQQAAPGFSYAHLLRVARNLCAAVKALHDRGYVVGDVNESNILVGRQALVTLIDTDSFQVRAGAQVYRCRVGKPEYTPPELQRARFGDTDRAPQHDGFGLAVLVFQLLMQGTHPFTGVYTGPGEPGAVPRWIEDGLFPYAQKKLPVRPRPHAPPWKVVPVPVQRLFQRCFEDGHSDPRKRPSAAEWLTTLTEAESGLRVCEANPQHRYPETLLRGCPWCEVAAQQGKDPFPSHEAAASATALQVPAATMKVLPAAPLRAARQTTPVAVAPAQPLRLEETWKWWVAGGATVFLILLGLGAVVGMLLARGRSHEERRPAEWVVEPGGTGITKPK